MTSIGDTPITGLLEQQKTIPSCSPAGVSRATVQLSPQDPRIITNRIFPSTNKGMGIISDIDDTIKETFVLEKAKAAQYTFLLPFMPVTGMQALFQRLYQNLNRPMTLYVSGSPMQLYPSIKPFVDQFFIPGPISLQKLTFLDPRTIIKMFDDDNIFNYKVGEIEKIYNYYPGKQFLTIGDSTQMDPETYAEM